MSEQILMHQDEFLEVLFNLEKSLQEQCSHDMTDSNDNPDALTTVTMAREIWQHRKDDGWNCEQSLEQRYRRFHKEILRWHRMHTHNTGWQLGTHLVLDALQDVQLEFSMKK